MPDLAAGAGITIAEEDPDIIRISTDVISGRIAYATYAELAALVPSTGAGTVAEIPTTDAGTHVDPVVGGVVANAGVYSYSTAPAGWKRIANSDSMSASGLLGGATVSAQQLKDWTAAESYQPAKDSWNGTTFVAVNVVWPDGSAGVFTPTTINATFLTIDAYTITHVASGKTVTQAAVTRDAAGILTAIPALAVA